MSKARDLANLLGGGTSGAITFGGTSAIRVPNGTTAERPTPAAGMIRYNTTTGFAEVYDGNIWAEFGAPPPSISTVTPSTYNGESGTTFTINGANFTADATVFFITSGGTEVQAGTVSFVSGAQLTATTPQDFTVADEPLDVKVVQLSGQITKLDVIDCGGVPAWNTSAGSLGTIVEDSAMSNVVLSATDPDGSAVTYSITSGALPTGVSLSNGVISGTPNVNDVYNPSGVTYNLTVAASDGVNTTTRSFSILKKWPDGSTETQAALSGQHLYDLVGATSGVYYIKPAGYTGSAIQLYVDNTNVGGGWMLIHKASRNRIYSGAITLSEALTTNDANLAELQLARIGDYHARVNWDFLQKLAAMSNCRRAVRAHYQVQAGNYNGYAHIQKLTSTGRANSGSTTTVTDIPFDPWLTLFNRSHWTTVAQQGTFSGSGLGVMNGNNVTFKFYNVANTPSWDSTNNVLTGTVSSPTPQHWEDWINYASGSFASNIGLNGAFVASRHTGAAIGDALGGDQWIYSTNNGSETATTAYEVVYFK
jgi:hypothetical protein